MDCQCGFRTVCGFRGFRFLGIPGPTIMLRHSEPACGGHGRQTIYIQVLLIMINMFCPTSYLIPIITLIISDLGDMNLNWRLKAMLETFLKDS